MNYTKEQLLAKAKPTMNGCLEWQGTIETHGYGVLGNHELAHRVMYTLTKGPIPFGKIVCHTCDNRPCINSEHLFVGGHADNTIDALNKGRIKRFQPTKLTDGQVLEIKQLLEEGANQYAIAEMYGVRQSHISRIKTGIRRAF